MANPKTYTTALGVTLTLDQNARLIDGQVYTLNPSMIVKDDKCYKPRPNASFDSQQSLYYVPSDSETSGRQMLNDVFVS